jgi:hypothetical protein
MLQIPTQIVNEGRPDDLEDTSLHSSLRQGHEPIYELYHSPYILGDVFGINHDLRWTEKENQFNFEWEMRNREMNDFDVLPNYFLKKERS